MSKEATYPEYARRFSRRDSSISDISKSDTTTPAPTSSFVNPLLNDLYQITMAYSYWQQERHELHSVFDLYFRKNPFEGEFTMFAGLDEVIKHCSNFRFEPEHIEYLKKSLPHCKPGFFDWLATANCSKIKVYAIPEGTIVFPRLPLIRVEGPIAIAQMLETTLLTLVNFSSLLATNALRHRLVTGPNKTLFEFGLRRAQGPDGGMSASRYAYMGGFDGTSNVLAGYLFGIPIKGTHAHAYITSFTDPSELNVRTMVDTQGKEHDFWEVVSKVYNEAGLKSATNRGELAAFAAYAISFPQTFLALVDSYDTLKSGVLNFLVVAVALHRLGYRAQGIRLDSGDLAYLSKEARSLFVKWGQKFDISYFEKMNIVASNDINEKTLASLEQQGHEIDTFGIGTNLVTCQAQPALGCVYKLVEVDGKPRIKLSQDMVKVTLPSRKSIYRLWGQADYPLVDLLSMENDSTIPTVGQRIQILHPFDQKKRAYITPRKVEELLKLYWDQGVVSEEFHSLDQIREYAISQVKQMRPDHLRSLNPTPYKVSITEDLHRTLYKLWKAEVPIEDLS